MATNCDAKGNATQNTQEGSEVITVARDGSRMASFYTVGGYKMSVPIYITAIYRARRRRDGVLTWRREGSYGRGTAGRGITGPMINHAQEIAEMRGCPYVPGCTHGQVCD